MTSFQPKYRMSARDLAIENKVGMNTGHAPANPCYGSTEIRTISDLPGVVGFRDSASRLAVRCSRGTRRPKPSGSRR